MHNMLIRPTAEELADFGEPDFVIYNAGGWVGGLWGVARHTVCKRVLVISTQVGGWLWGLPDTLSISVFRPFTMRVCGWLG